MKKKHKTEIRLAEAKRRYQQAARELEKAREALSRALNLNDKRAWREHLNEKYG